MLIVEMKRKGEAKSGKEPKAKKSKNNRLVELEEALEAEPPHPAESKAGAADVDMTVNDEAIAQSLAGSQQSDPDEGGDDDALGDDADFSDDEDDKNGDEVNGPAVCLVSELESFQSDSSTTSSSDEDSGKVHSFLYRC